MTYKSLVQTERPLSFCKVEMQYGRKLFTIYVSINSKYTLSDSFVSEDDAWKRAFELIF